MQEVIRSERNTLRQILNFCLFVTEQTSHTKYCAIVLYFNTPMSLQVFQKFHTYVKEIYILANAHLKFPSELAPAKADNKEIEIP